MKGKRKKADTESLRHRNTHRRPSESTPLKLQWTTGNEYWLQQDIKIVVSALYVRLEDPRKFPINFCSCQLQHCYIVASHVVPTDLQQTS